MRPKKPFIPQERQETVRQLIITKLQGNTLSAKDLSARVSASEKEVYAHLEHIQKTLNKKELRLLIIPPQCRKCGFEFKKRERLKKPGKCPVCHGESIRHPLFSVHKQ
jgi:predicted Zn-ribbon and HTH transcriptional regulator